MSNIRYNLIEIDGELGRRKIYCPHNLKYLNDNIDSILTLSQKLIYSDTDTIEPTISIAGSIVLYNLFEIARDIDFESTLVINSKNGNISNLFNPFSKELKCIVTYFQKLIYNVLNSNTTFRFVDFKAGEYFSKSELKYIPIKWNLEDIFKGSKLIDGNVIKLEEALSHESRIKIDWAIPSIIDSLNEYDYMEVTVLYTLAIKNNFNQAIRRVFDNEIMNEALPLRITSIVVDNNNSHAYDISNFEKSIAVELLHQKFICKIIKYYKEECNIKVLRLVYALLNFWENPILHDDSIDKIDLIIKIEKIIKANDIKELYLLKGRTEFRILLEKKNITSTYEKEQWLNSINKKYELNYNNSSEELLVQINEKLTLVILKYLELYPVVDKYINYVRKRSKFVLTTKYEFRLLYPFGVFIALKPNKKYLKTLEQRIKIWEQKFDLLKFEKSENIHMTLQYIGRISNIAIREMYTFTKSKIEGGIYQNISEIQATKGGLCLMGKRKNIIAINFKGNNKIERLVKDLQSKSITVGGIPEKTFLKYKPHISILKSLNISEEKTRKQVEMFLSESIIDLNNIDFESFEILSSNKINNIYNKINLENLIYEV